MSYFDNTKISDNWKLSRLSPQDGVRTLTRPVDAWATQRSDRPGDVFSDMLDFYKQYNRPQSQQNIADLASVFGSYSSGEKANRLTKGDLTQNYDEMMLRREEMINKLMMDAQSSRNQNEADAFRKMQIGSYVAGGGANNSPVNISMRGRDTTLPSFGGVPKPSPEMMDSARTMMSTVKSRLEEDGSYIPSFSYQPHPLESYANPGMAEKIGSWAGVGLGGISALPGVVDKIPWLNRLFGGGGAGAGAGIGGSSGSFGGVSFGGGAVPTGMTAPPGSMMSQFLSKGAPIAGAAMGTYGLMRDRGPLRNISNGAMAGAGYGSFIPGIGTAIGAGIGAGVGALRGLGGGPNETELAARDVKSGLIENLVTKATPVQIAEAQGARWENPQDALASIILRDQVIRQGGTEAQAGQLFQSLLDAVSGSKDPAQVQQAAGIIQEIMNGVGPRTSTGTSPTRSPGTYVG